VRAFVVALAIVALVGIAILAWQPELAGLWLLGVYCIPANSILPIPHEPGVLFAAAYYAPLAIAVAATAGSIVASFADYAVVHAALRRPNIAKLRETRLGAWAIAWMRRAPFAIIVATALVPLLPISVIRALAPASGYPLGRYIAAQVVGRMPRFYGLAYLGNAVAIPGWAMLVITAATLGLAIASSRR